MIYAINTCFIWSCYNIVTILSTRVLRERERERERVGKHFVIMLQDILTLHKDMVSILMILEGEFAQHLFLYSVC